MNLNNKQVAHRIYNYLHDTTSVLYCRSFAYEDNYLPSPLDMGMRWTIIGREGAYRLAMCRQGWTDGFGIIAEGVIFSLEAYFYEQDRQERSQDRQEGA